MAWHARLSIDIAPEAARSVVRHRHDGPLRLLKTLYPEGDGIAHLVLVHPPGGLVGGDTLDIEVTVQAGAHGLITTPGAARFYRSEGDAALQRSRLRLGAGARLEWLPLEALCYSGCLAENRVQVELDNGAELMGWDVTALGLPHADQPYTRGVFQQHLEWAGHWLERGRVDADDRRLLDGTTGLAGRRCMATLFLMGAGTLDRARRDAALDAARAVIDAACPDAAAAARGTGLLAGATAPAEGVVAVRAVADVVEPAMDLLRAVRRAWRETLWHLPATDPRIWAM